MLTIIYLYVKISLLSDYKEGVCVNTEDIERRKAMAKNNNLMKKSGGREGRNPIQRVKDSWNDMSTDGKVKVVGIVSGCICVVVGFVTHSGYRLDTKWSSLKPAHLKD